MVSIFPTKRWARITGAVLLLLLGVSATASADTPPGFDPDRHMTVDEVEPGMRGYGMTVFHGTEPEPFRVEVVSVERGFAPGKSVVWVRCPDERMQVTGPVQGMSGSPIYLWTEEGDGIEHEPGEGGRMLGAFAFGHRLGKDCYVGVQPITQMLEVAARAGEEEESDGARAAAGGSGERTFEGLFRLARRMGLDEHQTWRMRAISDLAGYEPPAAMEPVIHTGDDGADALLQDNRVALPVMVGSAPQADLLQPLFAAHGLAARAGSAASNLPPPWIDSEQVTLEPGGVFAIPLTFGPMEMAAIGTTTEVLPDGTVLAFGHEFFAQGPIAMPMAAGFVHFIQPNLSASFKLGGSANVTGAMVRDETSAVVGKPGAEFSTVPVTVHARWPDPTLNADYEYQVVQHEQLLPSLIGSVAATSLISDTEMPRLNTLSVEANIHFSNGRVIKVDTLSPDGSAGRVMTALAPPLTALTENQFGSMRVEKIDATIRVEDTLQAARIIGATVDQPTVAPGETLVIHTRLQPYRESEQLHRVELEIPRDVPEGRYMLTIGGAEAYQDQRLTLRPHLARSNSPDELFDAVQQVLSIRDDALYAVLQLNPANNLAIGRSELPDLPSSRLAMLEVESSTRATPFIDSVERVKPMPWVILNQVTLPVDVREEPNGGN